MPRQLQEGDLGSTDVAFVCRQCEFNVVTKDFYPDGSVPKKKLTTSSSAAASTSWPA
jgi:hypothetical protein